MDFRRLGYFAQVAELGTLLRTSEKLGISQPSLSRQMRILEDELGVRMFDRGARGMRLTEAGELFYARICGPLRQIGRAVYEVRSLPRETGGAVVFGMSSTIVQALGGPLARRVAAEAPELALRILDGESRDLLDRMRAGEIDVAIFEGPAPNGLNAAKLLVDELMLVAPDLSGVIDGQVADFAMLGEIPLILPGKGHPWRSILDSHAESADIRMNIVAEAESHHMIRELALARMGFGILPHCAFMHESASGRLAFARIVKPTPTRQLFLTLRPDSRSPRAAIRVERLAREVVGAMIGTGAWQGARPCDVGET